MKDITHKLLWSARNSSEHDVVLEECRRVAGIGGRFKVENVYTTDNWYTLITIYYPDTDQKNSC